MHIGSYGLQIWGWLSEMELQHYEFPPPDEEGSAGKTQTGRSLESRDRFYHRISYLHPSARDSYKPRSPRDPSTGDLFTD